MISENFPCIGSYSIDCFLAELESRSNGNPQVYLGFEQRLRESEEKLPMSTNNTLPGVCRKRTKHNVLLGVHMTNVGGAARQHVSGRRQDEVGWRSGRSLATVMSW